jgi:branched-chain amino acid aminotransferase
MLQTYEPKNADLIVNINGNLVHRQQAGVSPFDSSVQNGDAVWEGLRLYNGRIFRLQQHLDRLRKSAALLQYQGYPADDYLIQQLRQTLAANKMMDGVHIRLTVTRGIKYTSGRRPFGNVLNQHIHSCNQLTSILAKLEANVAGADDALMLDTDGFLAETNATHVFIVRKNTVETSTTRACPEGITRSVVLELCEKHAIPCNVRDIPPGEIASADEVFCSGTMGELTPVKQIDSTIYNRGLPGAVCKRLSSLFRELTLDAKEGFAIR